MTEEQQAMFDIRPKEKTRRGRQPETCCPNLPTDKTLLIIHQLSHRRTPFTTGLIAEMAETSMWRAREALGKAVDLDWCMPSNITVEDRGEMYMGKLKP